MSNPLPSVDELNERIDAMQACIKAAEELELAKLPSIDELNEHIDAMQACIRLAEELPELRS